MRQIALVGTAVLMGSLTFGVAEAAAPLPLKHRGYAQPGSQVQKPVRVSLVMQTTKRIAAGNGANGVFSSGVVPTCPSVKHQGSVKPFALIGMPSIALKLQKGKYRFAKTYTRRNVPVTAIGGTSRPFTAKVTLSGFVRSPSSIAVTVKISGAPCNVSTRHLTASLQPKQPGAMG
jgi:hypothetical protein